MSLTSHLKGRQSPIQRLIREQFPDTRPARHHRRSVRLRDYDYSQPGAYFVTLVTRDRTCLFGEVAAGQMRLSACGAVAAEAWQWLARQYPYVHLDAWTVMPNHLHGIIVIADWPVRGGSRRGSSRAAPTTPASHTAPPGARKPLGGLIGAFRTVSTRGINAIRNTPGVAVWQRNYYEHIVRNQESLEPIREYIANNPLRWELDRENPAAVRRAPPIPSDEPWRA